MARGRKPLPSHLKLIKGNPGHRPLNENEPKPELSIPEVPPHLSDEAKLEWARVVVKLHLLGLMSALDMAVLGAYCQSYARWVQAETALARSGGALVIRTSNGNFINNPLVGIANTAMAEMTRYATEFGMTPSARSRIDVGAIGTQTPETKTGLAAYRR